MPAIMPERLAHTDPNEPVNEMVGSGPFRFVADEHVPGARIVYERHAAYVPRARRRVGFTAGPKLAKLERVEWTIVPDPATAVAALRRGEVDWMEAPTPDLMPVLARDPGVTIKIARPGGAHRPTCASTACGRLSTTRGCVAPCSRPSTSARCSPPCRATRRILRPDVGVFALRHADGEPLRHGGPVRPNRPRQGRSRR